MSLRFCQWPNDMIFPYFSWQLRGIKIILHLTTQCRLLQIPKCLSAEVVKTMCSFPQGCWCSFDQARLIFPWSFHTLRNVLHSGAWTEKETRFHSIHTTYGFMSILGHWVPCHTKHDMIRTNSDWNKQSRWGIFVLMNLFVSWARSQKEVCLNESLQKWAVQLLCVIHSKRSWMSVYAKASFYKK